MTKDFEGLLATGALADLGRFKEAVAHYQATLRIDPKNAKAHYNWGVTLATLRRPQEAMGHFQEPLPINPVYA